MPRQLTQRQREVLGMVIRHEARWQTPMTAQAIADDLGIAQFSGFGHLKALAKRGLVEKLGGHYFAVRNADYWREWLAALPQEQRADLFAEVVRQFTKRMEQVA